MTDPKAKGPKKKRQSFLYPTTNAAEKINAEVAAYQKLETPKERITFVRKLRFVANYTPNFISVVAGFITALGIMVAMFVSVAASLQQIVVQYNSHITTPDVAMQTTEERDQQYLNFLELIEQEEKETTYIVLAGVGVMTVLTGYTLITHRNRKVEAAVAASTLAEIGNLERG